MPWIHVQSGLDTGRSFEVADGATLGREPACTVSLRDVSISRRHARIALEDGTWRVHDTQSRNGLAVRGERVPSAALVDGAEFQLGEVLFRFDVDARPKPASGASAQAVPSAASPSAAPKADEPDEIVLEGDWSAPPAPTTRPDVEAPRAFTSELERTAARPLPRAPEPAPRPAPPSVASPAPAPARAPTVGGASPTAPSRGVPARGVQMRASARGEGGAAATRAVLQYNKVEAQEGLAHADLGQLPGWAKLAIAVLALAVFAALFWAAFHTASFFKGKTSGTPADTEETAPDEAGR